jgi:DNA polymerase-3 subunit delta'
MRELYPWQKDLWQRWTELRARLPHAVMLKGPQGIGKLDFALNLAQSLLCETPLANSMACDNCASCHWFGQETHPDFRFLQPDALSEAEDAGDEEGKKKKPSRQISVDQIRSLAGFASLSAHRGGHRVVLIHPAEAMNANAANALLKTLEEPSAHLLIILVSHKPQQLLPTILSRCMALAMPLPAPAESISWLQQRGIKQPGVVLALAGFAPLQAGRLADAGSGTGDYAHFLQEIRHPPQLDPFALAKYLEPLQKNEPVQVIHWLQQWCYDLGSANLIGKVRYNTEHADFIKTLSGKVNPIALLRYQQELMAAKRSALHPLNPLLQLESILLSYRQMMLTSI